MTIDATGCRLYKAALPQVLHSMPAAGAQRACSAGGSTMSLKSRFTSSTDFSGPPRCHQCRREVSRTSLGVPSHLAPPHAG